MKKILILTSNPRNDLKLSREIKDLKNVIKRAKNQSQFETEFELEVHPEDLQDLLLEHEPRIVHFCGHGTGEQGLVFKNLAEQEQIISTEALSSLFALFDKSCECVLLNACYSEVQARAIIQHINYAIGMKQEIRDDAAIAFATGFYRALGWGKSIEEAYKFGRNAIQIQIAKDNNSRSRSSGANRQMEAIGITEQVILPEDLKPVLKIKSVLTPFADSLNSAGAVEVANSAPQPQFSPELVAAVEEEEKYKEYREDAREAWDQFGQSPLFAREPITQNEYRQRKTLLSKVKQFWIEGFLKPSLYASSAINLDWKNSSESVLRPFEGVKDLPIELDESFEELQTTDILSQTGEGKTLLILGEPGSGKTITLLQLAEKLVRQTEQDLTKPIPVVFNLSSWGQKQQTIERWLIEEFKDKYQVPKTWSEAWIQKEQLILLLDGLDEVEQRQRNACVKSLNQFIATHNVAEMVVCSRVKDYQALSDRLQLSSAICIKPLSSKHVYNFLTKAGDSLAGLKQLLQSDQELEQFAQTPLILNIMSLAYQDWSIEDLLQQFNTGEDRYRHLFDSYIQRMLRHRTLTKSGKKKNSAKYPQEKVLQWLSWLAKMMISESKIIFLIEKMQPTLLQNRSKRISYRIWIFLSSGLIFGLIFGLSFGLIKGLINSLNYLIIDGLSFGLIDWLIKGLIRELPEGLKFGLIGGLIVGLIVRLPKKITLFEQISWSWRKARSRFLQDMLIFGLVYGLIFVLIGGLSFGRFGELLFESNDWLIKALLGVLGGAPIGLLKSGLISNEMKQRTIPNQGIRSSRKNSFKIGLIFGLMGGLSFGLIKGLTEGLSFGLIFGLIFWLVEGLNIGLIVGLIVGLINGGVTCIHHFNLRRILHRQGHIPWNYARFLD